MDDYPIYYKLPGEPKILWAWRSGTRRAAVLSAWALRESLIEEGFSECVVYVRRTKVTRRTVERYRTSRRRRKKASKGVRNPEG